MFPERAVLDRAGRSKCLHWPFEMGRGAQKSFPEKGGWWGRYLPVGRFKETQVVLADIGSALLLRPQDRVPMKLRTHEFELPVCTLNYRPPDLLLGSQTFSEDLDSWAVGCTSLEMYLRTQAFGPKEKKDLLEGRGFAERQVMAQHLEFLGEPSAETLAWLRTLPLAASLDFENQVARCGRAQALQQRLRGCPLALLDFAKQFCIWEPAARLKAAAASRQKFLTPPCLYQSIRAKPAKLGLGSVVVGQLEDEVLEYLQHCPDWEKLYEQTMATGFWKTARCVPKEEGELELKSEIVGYVDQEQPPKCKSLNSDPQLTLIGASRLRCFVCALRRAWKDWLNQLSKRIQDKIRKTKLPRKFLAANGHPFLKEDMADNALVYASIQIMKTDARDDPWHTDGGSSLLHAGLPVFGSRNLEVELIGKEGCISLRQQPGSFYVGNMCAMRHRVVHKDSDEGAYRGETDPFQPVQMAVMLRSDVFRCARARKANATPGPTELFQIVNDETALHLATQTFRLPSLAEVVAESRRLPAKLAGSAVEASASDEASAALA